MLIAYTLCKLQSLIVIKEIVATKSHAWRHKPSSVIVLSVLCNFTYVKTEILNRLIFYLNYT